jgi:hypothetical protein
LPVAGHGSVSDPPRLRARKHFFSEAEKENFKIHL